MDLYPFEGCCMLGILAELDCLGAEDEWSKEDAAQLPELLKESHHSTVAVASEEHGKRKCEKQLAILRKHGFRLLGTFKGMGRYKNYLMGRGFDAVRGKRSAKRVAKKNTRRTSQLPSR